MICVVQSFSRKECRGSFSRLEGVLLYILEMAAGDDRYIYISSNQRDVEAEKEPVI